VAVPAAEETSVITVRAIDPSELPGWVAAVHVPFFVDDPIEAEVEYRLRDSDLSRYLAAFDGGRIVGTCHSLATDVSVPGGLLPASAVTMVTVLPTHRRRGILTTMMEMDLRSAADRGEPVAILISSEYPIYGRYGFGPAGESASYDLRGGSRFRDDVPRAGTVEYVEGSVLREIAPALYDRSRAGGAGGRAGQIARKDGWWNWFCGLVETPWPALKPGRIVLHRDDAGAPQGYLRYHVEDVWKEGSSASTLHLDDLIACTDDAYAALWRFATEVDLVRSIRADDRPVDEAARWLLRDARDLRQLHRVDGMWARVLDAPAALAGRRYAVDGSLVLEVDDPNGYAAGRWRLEAGPGGATCSRTTAPADLALSVAALGACYLGGRSFRDWAAAGVVSELRAGACARADALFRTAPLPWCSTHF
jgi:predicted acetyltransferase